MNASDKVVMAANAATIIAALLLSAVLIKVYLLPTSPSRPLANPPATEVGTNLESILPSIDWPKNGHTLVLALSTKCHFCTESAPFFRRLVDNRRADVKVVAVLPQPIAESEQYLKGEDVHVDAIKQGSLSRLGIRGTPTMLLADGAGVVSKIWVGMLATQQQEQVLRLISKPLPNLLIRPATPAFGGTNP